MASNTPVKLEYFDIAGAAEKVRLALVVSGVSFDDVRISFPDWPARKSTAKYGQLPIMTLPDGKEIYQSDAMLHWAACQGDGSLYPQDINARLLIDEVMGVLGDLQNEWRPAMYAGMRPEKFGYDDIDPETKTALTKKLRERFLVESLPRFMGYLQSFIEEGGNSFLCGATLTIADLTALPLISYYSKGIADFVPTDTLNAYPVIEAWIARVLAYPPIAEYYASR